MNYKISDFIINPSEDSEVIVFEISRKDSNLPTQEQLVFVKKWIFEHLFTPNKPIQLK